jgi:hypothetical protein
MLPFLATCKGSVSNVTGHTKSGSAQHQAAADHRQPVPHCGAVPMPGRPAGKRVISRSVLIGRSIHSGVDAACGDHEVGQPGSANTTQLCCAFRSLCPLANIATTRHSCSAVTLLCRQQCRAWSGQLPTLSYAGFMQVMSWMGSFSNVCIL